jgi:hypothetical protein
MQSDDNSYIAFRTTIKLLRKRIGDGSFTLNRPFLPLLQFHPHFFQRSLTVTPSFLKTKNSNEFAQSQIRHINQVAARKSLRCREW